MKLTLVNQQKDINDPSTDDIKTVISEMKKGDSVILDDVAKGDRYFMQALYLDDTEGGVFDVELSAGGGTTAMKTIKSIDRSQTEVLLQKYLKHDDSYKMLGWQPLFPKLRGLPWKVIWNLLITALLTLIGIGMIISGEVASGIAVTVFFGLCAAFCIFWLKMNTGR